MKRKTLYYILIIISFTLIYALATGVYFSSGYRAIQNGYNFDTFTEVYFYLLNTLGIVAVCLFFRNNYTKSRMILSYSISLLLTIVCGFLLFLPLPKSAFLAIMVFTYILIGCTQGVYVFILSLFTAKSQRSMVLAIAASISVLINSSLSLIKDGLFVQSLSAVVFYLIVAVISITLFIFTLNKLLPLPEVSEKEKEQSSSTPPLWNSKSFFIACIFISLSWLIQSLAFFFPFNSALVLGVSSEVLRITNILGLLVGGYINSRDKKIGALSCLIILATPMLYIILQKQAGATLLVFLLSYFFTGILSVYRVGIIADMSDSVNSKGESMTYLCAFGLIFGRIGEGCGGLMGIKFQENTMLLLTITCFVLVIAVAFFIFHYIYSYIPVPHVVQSHEEIMNSFKAKYVLSGREMDVLELLVDGNSNAEIADRLYVSENTVRFHVSNILKKTGCKSRKELSSLVYGSGK